MGGIAKFLLTDPQVIGGLQWFGTFATLIGFWIAFAQLKKTKNAAEAALEATSKLGGLVQGREQLIELNAAITHLENARNSLSQGGRDGASIYIELAGTSLIQASELLVDTPLERKHVKRGTVNLKRLAETLAELPEGAVLEDFTPLALAARSIVAELKPSAARLRYNYDNPR
ncbi:MAG: hypothetical protein P0Y65_18395 [Candidatus Devosia phytovorans]|uniref:Uncharacterized protein n=1 Tax=Candidatus Devosia phytovorans TaxID=3121372 RepID=A0AAJ5VVC3_9HYPH|nr:hypothetical protein [Devosia sp.]WEK04128.1 MAG: hypothetical protein P0Y65_18395 [Devosia sp.]